MPRKSRGSSKPTKRLAMASKAGVRSQGSGDRSGKRNASSGLSRPFAADVLEHAQAIVANYQIILTSEDGEWFGRGLELPHVFGDGLTPARCIDSTREALTAAVAYILEQGQTPPAPAKQGKRTT